MNPEFMPSRRAKAQCTGRYRNAVTQGLKRKAQADAVMPSRRAKAQSTGRCRNAVPKGKTQANVANSNRRKQEPAAIGNNKENINNDKQQLNTN
jgi:hypothetical protein